MPLRPPGRAKAVGRRAGPGEFGRIELACVSSAARSSVLSFAVSPHRRTYPTVTRRLHNFEASRQLEALAEGRPHACRLRPPATYPPGLSGILVWRQSVVIALPSHHPLADRHTILAPMLGD